MRETGLEGQGFTRAVESGEWLVASNSYKKGLNDPASFSCLGRHMSTDEVFILLCGRAVLVLGGKDERIGPLETVALQPYTACTVEKGEWHALLFADESRCLIVENSRSREGENYSVPVEPALAQRTAAAAARILERTQTRQSGK